ncbi:MAG: amidohydrolase family protein [Burkholderiales bacterium]|nr:amidohydrolase family protein [Burkholderiales bacterium]
MTDPIIDAHHHIWRVAKVPWLNGPQLPRIFGDYGALRRDYPVSELLADMQSSNVVKSVYIQINVAPGNEVEEVEWVQSVADESGFPHGIVGYADLAAPDVAATLDRQLACANLRGIRQQLHWHEKPLYRFAPRPDLMNDPAWRAGLRQLEQRGLLFELQVFASQMMDAAKLAQDFPGVTFVLLHAGMLEDRSTEGWAAWRKGMRALAACSNVVVKLSGLGTFEHQCSTELWQSVIRETVEMFGPERCLYGSNYPIEKLWTSYDNIVAVMTECLSGLPRSAQRAIFFGNALRVYRL